MNKRIMLIAILLLNLLVAATTVLARELSEPRHATTLATTTGAGIAHLAQPAEQSLRLAGSAAFPTASGRATVDTAGREIKVEVSGLGALAGQTVDVTIGGARAGSMTIGADGQGVFHAAGDSAAAILAAANGTALELRAGAIVVAGSQLPADDNSTVNVPDDSDDNDDNANDNGDDHANDNGDDNANDNGDDNANDNGDDNANDNGDDNANDNGDDNANDNGDDNANDNGDDNANDNGDDNGDDNANDNGDDNANDNGDDHGDDDNDNDNNDDHGGHDDHDDAGGDDNSGSGHDDNSGHH